MTYKVELWLNMSGWWCYRVENSLSQLVDEAACSGGKGDAEQAARELIRRHKQMESSRESFEVSV